MTCSAAFRGVVARSACSRATRPEAGVNNMMKLIEFG